METLLPHFIASKFMTTLLYDNVFFLNTELFSYNYTKVSDGNL